MAMRYCNARPPIFLMRLAWALALSLCVGTACATSPGDLTYLTEDYPPENFVRDGKVQGYSVEILKAIWRKLGVAERPIQVLPWARGYAMALNQPRVMLFAMARTADREKRFRWVGPFYQANIALLAPAGRRVKAKTLDEAKQLRIAVIRDDIGVDMLKQQGFPDSAMYLVSSLTQGLKMLDAGRVGLLCTNPASLPPGYRTLWSVGEVKDYYALSLGVEPDLVARFQSALDSLGDERRTILKKYHAFE